MKYREIGFFFILFVSFISCTYAASVVSDEINEAFKTVDNSIKSSSIIVKSNFEILYDSILDSYSKHPEIIQRSDSVYCKTLQIVAYIDSVKNLLHLSDTNGSSMLVSQRLLVNNKLGRQLYQNLIVYYKFAEQNIKNSDGKKQLASLRFNYLNYYPEKKWLELSFKNTPTVASKTILSKIKSDYYQIGFLMLKEINECENKVSRESYYNPKLSSK